MPDLFVYQILAGHTHPEDLDPGFLVLDNSKNARPDWFEYWPIRNFLLNQPLQEDAFYGFVSPRFKSKTNLSAAAVQAFVGHQSDAIDVVLFSPSLHLSALHWNVFKYGDSVHPGLLAIAEQFFESIGQTTDLNELVTHSSTEVYSNYIVAKPRFWRAWLNITEQLYTIAESALEPLGAKLRATTSYRGKRDVQMKVFIMERIATWLLARDCQLRVVARDPFVARSRLYKLPTAIACDALKVAYATKGGVERYKEIFQLASGFGKFLNWQVRMGYFFFKPVRSCVDALASDWTKAGQA